MTAIFKALTAALLCLGLALPAAAQTPEPRLALVLGNAEYAGGPVPTAANDAGLVAESLRQAGFDVTGAANLDHQSLRNALEDFAAKVGASGQGGVAFVYLAGRGVQYAGENYFLPVDAQIARDSDIPMQGARVSDLTRALAAMPLKARIVVLDAARATPMIGSNEIAGGLALQDADRGFLLAYNAAPGTIAPDEPAPYGAYARALVEMMSEGGVPVNEVFVRTRLRVNEVSKGSIIPWHSSNLEAPFVFFEAAAGAAPAVSLEQTANIRKRPIRDFSADEAYSVVLERDNVEGYQEYLNAYPNAAQAARVRAMLAARREALTWRRTYLADTPNAYWTYLRRYPHGPHAFDARRRLAILRAELIPPPQFEVYAFEGLPPPPPEEVVFIDRGPAIVFEQRYGFMPPPPPPIFFVPPRPAAFYDLAPPPPPPSYGYLPLVAAPLIAAPLIMKALRPRPPGVYIQPNFGQVRGPQGGPQPGHGGLQVMPGGQVSPLAAQPGHFGGRPGMGVPGAQPGAQGLVPMGRPGALPGTQGGQPLPGAMGGRPGMGVPGAQPGAQGLVPMGRPGGALPGTQGGQPLPGAMGGQRPAIGGAPGVQPGAQGLVPATRPGAPAGPSPQQQLMQQRQQQLQLKQQQQQELKAQQLQRQQQMQQQRQQQLQQRQEMQRQRQQQMQQQRQQQMQQRQQLMQQRQQSAPPRVMQQSAPPRVMQQSAPPRVMQQSAPPRMMQQSAPPPRAMQAQPRPAQAPARAFQAPAPRSAPAARPTSCARPPCR